MQREKNESTMVSTESFAVGFPCCLTVAGSDSGGGAGVQADLRTFYAWNVHGTSVLTAITAQNPHRVTEVMVVPSAMVRAQLQAVMEAFQVRAAKTGMLATKEIIEMIIDLWHTYSSTPLIVDPVMVATSGARLLDLDGIESLRRLISQHAFLVTPNLLEAEILIEQSLRTRKAIQNSFPRLRKLARNLLLKGGHSEEEETIEDFLITPSTIYSFKTRRLLGIHTHGTGCTLSAAITAALALGYNLVDAVLYARAFLYRSLQNQQQLGEGTRGFFPVPPTQDVKEIEVSVL